MAPNLLTVNGGIAPETTKSRIRDRVRERIRLSGMSANEICKKARAIDPGHLSRWLSGNSNMDLDRIEELAAVLGTSLPELIADQAAASHIPIVALSRLPTTVTARGNVGHAGSCGVGAGWAQRRTDGLRLILPTRSDHDPHIPRNCRKCGQIAIDCETTDRYKLLVRTTRR